MVMKCVFLCAIWQSTGTTGALMIGLENGLERKKIIYVAYHGLERENIINILYNGLEM